MFDLVERFGHEPLSTMATIQERVDNIEIDMPPLNVTLEDIQRGLKYAGIEVPSGIRGRMATWGPLIDQAEAAILMNDAPFAFGCVGCHRTNLLVDFLIKKRKIPTLEIEYPTDDEEARIVVLKIKEFLGGLK